MTKATKYLKIRHQNKLLIALKSETSQCELHMTRPFHLSFRFPVVRFCICSVSSAKAAMAFSRSSLPHYRRWVSLSLLAYLLISPTPFRASHCSIWSRVKSRLCLRQQCPNPKWMEVPLPVALSIVSIIILGTYIFSRLGYCYCCASPLSTFLLGALR